jgi:hypothetical protein
MGRNSVIPSTTPKTMALKISKNIAREKIKQNSQKGAFESFKKFFPKK